MKKLIPNRQGYSQAEANIALPSPRIVAVAVSNTASLRIVKVAAAAIHAEVAKNEAEMLIGPRRIYNYSTFFTEFIVLFIVPVLAPFPYIAVKVK